MFLSHTVKRKYTVKRKSFLGLRSQWPSSNPRSLILRLATEEWTFISCKSLFLGASATVANPRLILQDWSNSLLGCSFSPHFELLWNIFKLFFFSLKSGRSLTNSTWLSYFWLPLAPLPTGCTFHSLVWNFAHWPRLYYSASFLITPQFCSYDPSIGNHLQLNSISHGYRLRVWVRINRLLCSEGTFSTLSSLPDPPGF